MQLSLLGGLPGSSGSQASPLSRGAQPVGLKSLFAPFYGAVPPCPVNGKGQMCKSCHGSGAHLALRPMQLASCLLLYLERFLLPPIT